MTSTIPFTGGAGLTGFKKKLHDVFMKNELNNGLGAYEISHARLGRSGYSFGPVQWDLLNNESARNNIFRNILENAGVTGLTTQVIEDIIAKVSTTGASLSSSEISLINQALQSTYGQQKINAEYVTELDNIIAHVDSIIASAAAQDQTFLQADLPRLFLCDYHNQYRISVNKQMHSFLRGEAANLGGGKVQKVGKFGIDDLLNFYFSTDYAKTTAGLNDGLRRFSNVVDIAGGYSLPTNQQARDEEAKGIVRVYQDFIKGKASTLSYASNFTTRVLFPARDYLVSHYVTNEGISIDINGEVIVGEDESSIARNTKHRTANDFPLTGSSSNDLIFGESGTDWLRGEGGDDVLYGAAVMTC